jgi:hypothetical protein
METIILNIDSKFRDKDIYPNSTNFKYRLDVPIKNVIEIILTSVRIPNTSYLISPKKGNNKLTVNNIELTIAEGNYDINNLISAIQTLIINNVNNDIKLELNPITGKIKFFSNSNSNFTVSFYKTTEYGSLANILGFTELDISGNIFLLNDDEYIGNNVINIFDDLYYLLKINDIGSVYNNNNKYFAKILSRQSKNFVDYEGNHEFVSKNFIFEQPIDLEIFNIQLFDYLNNNINLNGLDIDLTLEIKSVRNNLLKQYKELNFYDEELMKLILNDQMLKYYVDINNIKSGKKTEFNETYQKILQDNIIDHPNVNTSLLKPSVEDTINSISSKYNNNDLKKLEEEEHKKREEKIRRRREKRLEKKLDTLVFSNKFKY